MRLITLVLGTFRPPPGKKRIVVAFAYGAICHSIFGLAVLAMIVAMFFGMSMSLGRVPAPWSVFANIALIIQFPVVHSRLLTRRGGGLLAKLAPIAYAKTLSTTTYAIVASLICNLPRTPISILSWAMSNDQLRCAD